MMLVQDQGASMVVVKTSSDCRLLTSCCAFTWWEVQVLSLGPLGLATVHLRDEDFNV